MHICLEGRTAIADHAAFKVTHMRIPHCCRDPAVGDDSGKSQTLNPCFAQHPFEPAHVEGGIGDFVDSKVGRCKIVNERMTERARHKITFCQKRT